MESAWRSRQRLYSAWLGTMVWVPCMNRNTIAIPEHTRTYKTNDDPKGQCREANGSVELSKSIHTLLFASLYSLNVGGGGPMELVSC